MNNLFQYFSDPIILVLEKNEQVNFNSRWLPKDKNPSTYMYSLYCQNDVKRPVCPVENSLLSLAC